MEEILTAVFWRTLFAVFPPRFSHSATTMFFRHGACSRRRTSCTVSYIPIVTEFFSDIDAPHRIWFVA